MLPVNSSVKSFVIEIWMQWHNKFSYASLFSLHSLYSSFSYTPIWRSIPWVCWLDLGRPYLHTYIRNWSLQPISQDYWPSFSHLYISGWTYSLKWTPNDRFFEKLFMEILFTSQSFCQKSAERKLPKKYYLYFVLMSGLVLDSWLFV